MSKLEQLYDELCEYLNFVERNYTIDEAYPIIREAEIFCDKHGIGLHRDDEIGYFVL